MVSPTRHGPSGPADLTVWRINGNAVVHRRSQHEPRIQLVVILAIVILVGRFLVRRLRRRGQAAVRPSGRLPTRQVVIVDGPHPPVEGVSITATLERGWSSPAVPSGAVASASGGHSRQPSIHRGSDLQQRRRIRPGRRDRTRLPSPGPGGATSEPRTTRSQRTTPVLPVCIAAAHGADSTRRRKSPEAPATVPLVPVAHCERDDLVVGSLPIRADWRSRGPP